jgi:hypothetical protein
LSNSRLASRGCASAFSPRHAPELCVDCRPSIRKRAQGKPDARCTRGLVCNIVGSAHTSIQGSGGNPTFPARCSTDYIVLTPAIWLVVTVAREYGCQCPVGMTGLRRLDAGRCGVGPTRFHRTQLHRSSARPGRSQVSFRSPALQPCPRARRSPRHRIPPHVRDDRDPPLSSGETGKDIG